MNKYHAVKTEVDGIKFDSKREAKRYVELKALEENGDIKDLELQPRFILQEGFKKNGKSYRPIAYKADFQYTDSQGNTIVEDVKGRKTEVYKIKKKIFEYKYPELTILET